MKKQIVTIALSLISIFLNTSSAADETGSPHAHVFIEVKGLACPFCVQGLEKHLKKLDAVATVKTSLKKGEVVLHLKPDRTVSEKEVRAAVEKAGFTAGKIRFEPKPPSDGEKSTASTDDETEPPPAHAFIEVKGLACPFCAQGLEKQLKEQDAVAAVNTSLKKGEVVLHLKRGPTVGEKELRATVKKAGFTADKIRFEPKPKSDDEEEKSDQEEKK